MGFDRIELSFLLWHSVLPVKLKPHNLVCRVGFKPTSLPCGSRFTVCLLQSTCIPTHIPTYIPTNIKYFCQKYTYRFHTGVTLVRSPISLYLLLTKLLISYQLVASLCFCRRNSQSCVNYQQLKLQASWDNLKVSYLLRSLIAFILPLFF